MGMSRAALVRVRLDGAINAIDLIDPVPIVNLAKHLYATIKRGNKILVFGNGGSAAQAQHFAAELVGRYMEARHAIPAIALTTDTSILTAVANDYGFESIFSRQIEALGKPRDVAIGISTSGQSSNVRKGLQTAYELGLSTFLMTGRWNIPEFYNVIQAPSVLTPNIQVGHLVICHLLCDLIDEMRRDETPSAAAPEGSAT